MSILQAMSLEVIILSSILGICIYIIFNMYYKIKKLEELLIKSEQIEQRVVNLIRLVAKKNIEAYAIIKKIDKRGSFESDDEIGIIYKIIRNTIKDLSDQMSEIFNEEKEEK